MSGKFSNQGNVNPTGTILHTCRINTIAAISYMRFNNSTANYTLTISKYINSIDSFIMLYSKDLTMGDTITDNMMYILDPGDYMYVECSILGTTYVITGEDIPNTP